jgi:hypothetical protein
MRRVRTRLAAVAIVAAGAGALSACSSRPTASRTAGSSHRTTTTTAPKSGASTSTTASSTTTTTAPAGNGVPMCQTSGLHVAVTGSQGAAGTEEDTLALTNTGSTSCTTYGYPGMLLLSASGAPLPTTVDRGGTLNFEDIAPALVQLAAGASAYFNVGYSDIQQTGSSCSAAGQLEVTPPTNALYAVVPASLRACDNGTLHVSAVFASTDAAATQTTAP